jgi:hypothetical protein
MRAVEAGYLAHGLVPDATSVSQQRLEALLLKELAHAVGSHAPERLGGPYGMVYVSPAPDTLTIALPGDGTTVLNLLLPRRAPDGAITGIPGLRWPEPGDRLVWHDGQAEVTIRTRTAGGYRHLSAQHPDDALWKHPPADDETAAATALAAAGTADAVWSTALRRIGLFSGMPQLDLAAGIEPAVLAGPAPHHLARIRTVRRRIPVIAVAGHRPQTGTTTLATNLAINLTELGARVLAVDLDPAGIMAEGLTNDAGRQQVHARMTPGAGWTIAVHTPDGPEPARAALDRNRDDLDVVLVDVPYGRADAVPFPVDVLLYPSGRLNAGELVTWAQVGTLRPELDLYAWLDVRFAEQIRPRWNHPSDDFDEDDLRPPDQGVDPELDDAQWQVAVDAARPAFTAQVAATAAAVFGQDVWDFHAPQWLEHSRRAVLKQCHDDEELGRWRDGGPRVGEPGPGETPPPRDFIYGQPPAEAVTTLAGWLDRHVPVPPVTAEESVLVFGPVPGPPPPIMLRRAAEVAGRQILSSTVPYSALVACSWPGHNITHDLMAEPICDALREVAAEVAYRWLPDVAARPRRVQEPAGFSDVV